MEDSITDRDRVNCWIILSDLFVDNEVDEKEIADLLRQQCSGISERQLKKIFFDEVAAVLGANLLTPAPEIWMGFDSKSVIREIRAMLDMRRRSLLYRLRGWVWGFMCRFIFRSIWQQLSSHFEKEQGP